MILLLSRQDDGSTREVATWLTAMRKDFLRINADDKKNRLLACNVVESDFSISVNQQEYQISLKDITSIWNRRSGFCSDTMVETQGLENIFHSEEVSAKSHLKNEANDVFDFLYSLMDSNKSIVHIGNQKYNKVNKLRVLKIAKECGLHIPNSYIISQKKDLLQLAVNKNLITKAIVNGVYEFTEEYGYYSYTERVTIDFINGLPETFFPSLVQEEIDKKYDLRVFYLMKQFYAMAIFSQELPQTETDSRKGFTADFMPRQVPYQLSKKIEKHLTLLMKKLQLNTGSIDLIVSKRNEFFFLEVNPIGQFGMISKPCNYYLEKEIAECL